MMTTTLPTAEKTGGAERARQELLNVNEVAELLNASTRTVYRLADAGKMPRPLKLGALVRWRREELRRWIADGCLRVGAAKRSRP